MVKSVVLIGGDIRHRMMAEYLIAQNVTVYCYGMDGCESLPETVNKVDHIPKADLAILPIPVSRNGLDITSVYSNRPLPLISVVESLDKNTLVCGGLLPSVLIEKLKENNISYFDYGTSETFAMRNAIPSAEGAIELALHHTPFTLNDARVCVVGYGRIGKILTNRLLGLGCNVTTTARKYNDLKEIGKSGATAIHTYALAKQEPFQILFNTVPAMVIDRQVLERQTKDTLVIDLASKPGGVDFDYAKQKGISCIHALSLPAKCAPATAAKNTLHAIEEFILIKEAQL